MSTEVYVFLSLFLVSVILHIIFAILKKDIIYKIAFSLHLPFLGCAQYFYLQDFRPDSEYLSILFILIYSIFSVSALLYMVLSEKLIIIPSLFYIAGCTVLYYVYKPVYYFYSISKPVVFAVSLFIIISIALTIIFSKLKNFRKIISHIVLNAFSLSVFTVTFFNLIYEKEIWCILAFSGSVFVTVFTIFKTLKAGERIRFSEKFIYPAMPVSALLFSLSSAFMYSLL